MGSYRQLTGMQSPPSRPDAIQPVPEEYEGVNFPYRGIENHGVAPTPGVDPEYYYDRDHYDAGPSEIPSVPTEKEPEPVKVKVVNESARERFEFRVFQTLAEGGDKARQFLGRNDKRSTVRVRVETAAPTNVLIGDSAGLRTSTGWLVEAGEELVIRTTEELWCVASKGGAGEFQNFYVIEEFSVEL